MSPLREHSVRAGAERDEDKRKEEGKEEKEKGIRGGNWRQKSVAEAVAKNWYAAVAKNWYGR